ncbi:MAG: PfkB family carbohydrate kinase [Candidatus Poseidoniales archaeon]
MAPEILVAGVLALDDLKTPYESRKRIVGGAGIYSSIASSMFAKTALVAAKGNDFPRQIIEMIKSKHINIESVKELDYPTFHWSGEYIDDMAQAITHETNFEINEHYDWEIIDNHKESKVLLLCNNDPNNQKKVLEQTQPEIVAMDTMNLWINIENKMLDYVVSKVNILFINDAEATQYTKEEELDKAAEILLKKGPKFIVIKKGEHGASLYTNKITKHLSAFKIKKFIDPTGAGDSFAGAAMGYIANCGELNVNNLITAMNYGAAVASVTVEGFGTESIETINRDEIKTRFQQLNGGPGRI